MDYSINLLNLCGNINLDDESAMFFVDEGIICVERRENEFYIDKKTADTLRLISEIKNELGVNDEGASVILNLREKIIDYQSKLKTVFDAMDRSKSIDELMFIIRKSESFRNIIGSLLDNGDESF
jgi:hypothetical protein